MIEKFKQDCRELHHQVYHGIRKYPQAFIFTGLTAFNLGLIVAGIPAFIHMVGK